MCYPACTDDPDMAPSAGGGSSLNNGVHLISQAGRLTINDVTFRETNFADLPRSLSLARYCCFAGLL